MTIPVFVSCPSTLNELQSTAREQILTELYDQELDPRSLGVSDYPIAAPLTEVLSIARHCYGGIILGFEQLRVHSGDRKSGTKSAEKVAALRLPTPWNQLEAGILIALNAPLLLLCESGIRDGVFELGSSGLFVHELDISKSVGDEVRPVIRKWQALVRQRYEQA